MDRPRPPQIRGSDPLGAEWRCHPENRRPIGEWSVLVVLPEQVGIEEPDLLAKSPTSTSSGVIGMDEPSGDPPGIVAIVVEDVAGDVRASKRSIEAATEELRQHVQGRRVFCLPEEKPCRREELTGRSIKARAWVTVGIVGRLTLPEAENCHFKQGQQVVDVGCNFLCAAGLWIDPEPSADLGRDRNHIVRRRLLLEWDVDSSAPLAPDHLGGNLVGKRGQPGCLVETQMDVAPFAATDRRAVAPASARLRQGGNTLGESRPWWIGLAHGRCCPRLKWGWCPILVGVRLDCPRIAWDMKHDNG